ncbi:helix-turn-helix domain-containing protein [uncultured Sphingomonas sp.]|uniref:helix-turn-helix domain-containing protein n=1 Tax=uncultured Sphingomonas sp. TaxID=158754 RepID=UPI0025E420ED|nr:helix-turn-helix domain-containing protein [uncultured Sphingomonas sp.]
MAISEPYTLFWQHTLIPLYAAEARVAFELVRFGQITIDRVCLLAPLAEDGNDSSLAHVRISRIRTKLVKAGANVRIVSRRGFGWQLVF